MGWRPRLSPKQLSQFDCDLRFQLLIGPKFSGKTYGLYHSVFKHLWQSKHARLGIISRTNRAGSTGIWPALTKNIYEEWIEAGIQTEDHVFGYVKPPCVDAVTKISRATIRNRYGGESEVILFPIERAEDAETMMFSTEFSALWISEGQYYKDRAIFDTCRAQLRLLGSRYEDQRLWVDMNPAEEGKGHWTYRIFFVEKNLDEADYDPLWDPATREAVREFRDNSAVFQFSLDDNTLGDPRQLANVRATYAGNPEKYRRFVLGEIPDRVAEASVFSGVFDENLHVVGDSSDPDPMEWEVIAPSNGTSSLREGGKVLLVGGWDPGASNHAMAIIQPWQDPKSGVSGFDILDEIVILATNTSLEAFTEKVLEAMRGMEAFAGFPISWEHYADGSTARFRSQVSTRGDIPAKDENTDAGVITAASRGEIRLIGCDAVKSPGWQKRRVDMVCRLLSERRLRISANCVETIRMLKDLRKDLSPKAKTYLEPGQPVKHIFDAISYAIAMRIIDELMDEGAPRSRKRSRAVSSA